MARSKGRKSKVRGANCSIVPSNENQRIPRGDGMKLADAMLGEMRDRGMTSKEIQASLLAELGREVEFVRNAPEPTKQMPVFEDAQEQMRLEPETFFAPTQADLDGIQPGSHVKVCAGGERFWVTVTAVEMGDELGFTGVVGNHLNRHSEHGLAFHDSISFRAVNVYQVMPS